MAHILIIGHGINGLTTALQLKKLIAEEDWITVVTQERYGVIKSGLPYVGLGLRPLDEANVKIKPILERFGIHHTIGTVASLHPERQIVKLDNGKRVPFDYLIVTDGMEPAFDHIPGLSQSRDMVHSLVGADEAMRAELAFQDFLNAPGPMTVALAPGSSDYQNAYQFVFNVDRLLRRYRLRTEVPIRFVTPEPFLGHFGVGGIGNSNRLFEGAFRARHIQWVCNAAIDRIDDRSFHILYFDDDGLQKGRQLLETRYGMLWPSKRVEPFIRGVDGLINNTGLLPTNRFLQSQRYNNIFATGEIVAPQKIEPTPMEAPPPCFDFLRESMTSTVVGNLAEILRERYPLYEPTGNGFFMIDYGARGAAFLAVPQCPPRNIDRIIEGRFVHVAKRAMERYHIRKLRAGITEPIFERLLFRIMKMPRIKQKAA